MTNDSTQGVWGRRLVVWSNQPRCFQSKLAHRTPNLEFPPFIPDFILRLQCQIRNKRRKFEPSTNSSVLLTRLPCVNIATTLHARVLMSQHLPITCHSIVTKDMIGTDLDQDEVVQHHLLVATYSTCRVMLYKPNSGVTSMICSKLGLYPHVVYFFAREYHKHGHLHKALSK